MDNIYILMIAALAILAIADLIVGVSNDAVNFLNSAIGSKAVSFKTVMIVASVGVAIGAVFSSGMMEVARKGIFNPSAFMFDEIMIIFMAVMITDILLLDFFNTIGMPTSTTVSIVFELLGAAVCMAIIKIYTSGGDFSEIVNYINTSKATQIVFGILLSVIVAFSIGAIVQWFSRLLLSYSFEDKAKWVGASFGGVALTAITYFIFMKGLKGTSYASQNFDILGGLSMKDFLENQVLAIVAISLVVWFVISYIVIAVIKFNIYKLVIVVGTFALALAFAGNDLVNFIGVPMAAYSAFQEWTASGLAASDFPMDVLSKKVPTNNLLLFVAGMIMVLTLWFSSKAKSVVKTSIDLASQSSDTKERFQPNALSRGLVRLAILSSDAVNRITPERLKNKINMQFTSPEVDVRTVKKEDIPAFDLVRAAVNLMLAAVLISIATSYKLPLSTTYVTFMVAMGTSLADRAWGAESAVYRVAGVINVVGGWFSTAIIAFFASALVALLLNININVMFPLLLVLAFGLIIRNYINHNKKSKEVKKEVRLNRAESSSVQGVIAESAGNIANAVQRAGVIFTSSVAGLAKQDLPLLKKNKKQVAHLTDEVDSLRDNLFYFIKNLDDTSVVASGFYINVLGSLQDISESLHYITKVSHKHINNNHKKLKFSQIKELKVIDKEVSGLFNSIETIFETQEFDKIGAVLATKPDVLGFIDDKIQKQVSRTRNEESSPKNTTLYFTLLIKTKDLLSDTMTLLEEYHHAHDSSVEPAKISPES